MSDIQTVVDSTKVSVITANTLTWLKSIKEKGQITMSDNYIAENALQNALFAMSKMKIGDKPALEVANKDSIFDSLRRMLFEGLNPGKHQCAFIPRGNEITYMREYQGDMALAKRYSSKEIESIHWNTVYEGDNFIIKTNTDGSQTLGLHESPADNRDNEIKGAYCIVTYVNGKSQLEYMTMKMIFTAWKYHQKKTYGKNFDPKSLNDTQTDFKSEMCMKTVIKRAMKSIINSSDDGKILNVSKDDDIQDAEYEDEKPVKKISIIGSAIKSAKSEKQNVETEVLVTDSEPIKQPSEEPVPDWGNVD